MTQLTRTSLTISPGHVTKTLRTPGRFHIVDILAALSTTSTKPNKVPTTTTNLPSADIWQFESNFIANIRAFCALLCRFSAFFPVFFFFYFFFFLLFPARLCRPNLEL
ncbi:uncharacterized protein YALI1_D26943g [Yarrowia lipolytica]|uniref:Uncharacterized protein n=1 Tax=Yarrowia lipolytica TaxID=4952 RepID=A0A1D8NFL2_YARLL|nr:hypothetical protein YALI1_D26943g [Yarrowia lipolytica]